MRCVGLGEELICYGLCWVWGGFQPISMLDGTKFRIWVRVFLLLYKCIILVIKFCLAGGYEKPLPFAAEAPPIFTCACKMFILELTHHGFGARREEAPARYSPLSSPIAGLVHAEKNKHRTMRKFDVTTIVVRIELFDFLIDIVPWDEAKNIDITGIEAGRIPHLAS